MEQFNEATADIHHIFSAGVGGCCLTIDKEFIAGRQQLRKQKHFHITLSYNDIHEIDKGLASLFSGQLHPSYSPEFS